MRPLRRSALLWVLHNPRVLLATVAHVVLVALMIAAVVGLAVMAPLGAVLLGLAFVYPAVFVAVLADATIVVAVRDASHGEPISLRRAWAVAWQHRGALAAWAFDLLTIGFAIRLAMGLLGRVGEIFGWAAEVAWATVALLVVPSIVVGDMPMPGAFDTSRRSLRETFGARLGGLVGISLAGFVFVLPFVVFVLVAALIDSAPLIVAALITSAAGWLAVLFVTDAASAVLGYAIYAHVERAPLPPSFGDTDLGVPAAPATP